MKKRILASICALACACTMSSPVYAKDLSSETELSTQQLDTSIMQTMSNTGSYNVTVRSDSRKMSPTDFTTITGTLNATNTTDTCTITVPERSALVLYTSAAYPSTSVTVDLTSQSGTALGSQYLYSSSSGISEDVDDGILVEPGTYTLTYTASDVKDNITYTTNIVAYAADTENNVELGAGYTNYHKSGEDVYKKVTVAKAGLLAVCGFSYDSGLGKFIMTGDKNGLYMYGESLTLCNSKKKAITAQKKTEQESTYVNYYAVKAGTYYVKISSSSDTYYSFLTDFKAGGTTSNTSKAKAQKLGTSYKSTLMPIGGSTKTRWYKVTLKKKKKFNIYYDFYGTDGAVGLSVYNSKGKELTYASSIYTGRSGKLSTTKKYPKGTYYIQVTKPSNSAYAMEGLLNLKVK